MTDGRGARRRGGRVWAALPSYDQLPVLDSLGASHAWDVFGAGDERGTLNLLDDTTVLAALQEVRTGQRVSLSLSLDAIDPPLYGREPLTHTLLQTSRNIWDERLDSFYPQASSQWDGFRHVRAKEHGFYGGATDDPPQLGTRLGVDHWAAEGIIGRGVLLDVGRYLAGNGIGYSAHEEVSVSAALLDEVAHAQGVEIRQGDVLCVRFGWLAAYRALTEVGRRQYARADSLNCFAGLAADESMARALWDWHVAAVACDNPAAEVSPGDPAVGSLHRRLIPLLGLVVGELFDLDRLAECCAEDSRWSFLLVSVPLNVVGAVASPSNAVAVR